MVPMMLESPGMIFGLEKGWSSTISKNYVLRFQKLYARIRKSIKDKSPQQCKFQICDSWISTSCTYTQGKKVTLHLPTINPPPTLTNRMTFLHLFNPQPRMKNNPGRSATSTMLWKRWIHDSHDQGGNFAIPDAPDPIHVSSFQHPSCACGVVFHHGFFNCLAWPSSKTMAHSIGSFGLNPLTNPFGQYSIILCFGRYH